MSRPIVGALVPLLFGCAAWASAAGPECEPLTRHIELPDALNETSGLAVSAVRGGVIWSHNDSGDDPVVYAVDEAGGLLQAVEVEGAEAVDWEDMAIGDCGPGFEGASPCLWVADVGDNAERRHDLVLYRFAEPGPTDEEVRAEAIPVTLPDGPRDIEALFLLPGGEPAMVTKGRNHPPTVYRAGADWTGGPIRFTEVQRFGARPRTPDVMITAADAVEQEGRTYVAVRSYSALAIFTWTGEQLELIPEGTVDLRTLREPQGEAVAWMPGATARLLLSSEARGGQPQGMITLGCRAVW